MQFFKQRSYKKEMLDEPGIPKADLFQNLRELNTINSLLGGHSVTINAIKKLLHDKKHTYNILDIGSGGGDTLLQIAKWAKQNGYRVLCTGVDMLPDCIAYAKENCKDFDNIKFVCDDYAHFMHSAPKFDLILTSLFCHHLTDDELIELFKQMNSHTNIAGVINDLHRHPFAYYSIKWLTAFLSKSYLVKNDAPLSVLRGFSAKELNMLLAKASIDRTKYSLCWKWAFRWELIVYSKQNKIA
jgi:SAM-dependent methyltransferase